MPLKQPHYGNAKSTRSDEQWVRGAYATDVSIIIVSYKSPKVLARGLQSIFAAKQNCSYDVIVIDNASGDGSVDMVREQFPQVQCIANTENTGHTGGCNQGMRIAQGQFLFLLNSDTVMADHALDALIDFLREHPNVGIAAPKVLNVDGTVQGTVKRFPTPWSAIFGRFSVLTKFLPQNRWSRQYLIYLDHDFSAPFAVDTASGAALMVRREAIDKAGPLDPLFFLYWNDVDWCRSIWEAGYQIYCVPASTLSHEEHHGGSRSSARQRFRTICNFHYGAYLYYRKWHIRSPWHPSHLLAIAGLTLRAMLVTAVDQWSGAVQYATKSRT